MMETDVLAEPTGNGLEALIDTEFEAAETAGPQPDAVRLSHIVESILFAAGAPISLKRLVEILDGPGTKEVQAAIALVKRQYAPGQRGIHLQEVAGGYQFRTARENAEWVRPLFREKPARLGRAALETIAIVAYKQPLTKAEIEAIRGVDVDGVLNTLLARKLIRIAGRKEAIGRPLLYATTPEFLEVFGLKDIGDLPSLKDLEPPTDAHDTLPTATDDDTLGFSLEADSGSTPATEAPYDGSTADDRAADEGSNLGTDTTDRDDTPIDCESALDTGVPDDAATSASDADAAAPANGNRDGGTTPHATTGHDNGPHNGSTARRNGRRATAPTASDDAAGDAEADASA